MKTCAKCKKQKELTEFRKHIRNLDGYQYYCKVCQNAMTQKWKKQLEQNALLSGEKEKKMTENTDITTEKPKDIQKFRPTALMEKFIQTAIRLGSDNVAEIVRETGMDESTYYEWKKKEGFAEWSQIYATELLKGDAWKLHNIGMKNAKRDHRYWESMQKIVGGMPKEGSTNVQVNILNKLEEDKQRYNFDS